MKTDFKVGADPELTILNENRAVIRASDCEGGGYDSKFGSDGNGVTFEVRPDPDTDPLKVVKNLRDLFNKQVAKYPKFSKYKWCAGSFKSGFPMGGHIHFGYISRDYSEHLNHLDNYLGLPGVLIEDRKEAKSRRQTGYGGLSDMRSQSWGLEYRALSSWLTSPYVSAAMLCLAKTVFHESLNNSKFPWINLVRRDEFALADHKRLLEHFPQVWKGITEMSLYQKYKPYIDIIYFLVSNKLTWFPKNGDMRQSWGLINFDSFVDNRIPMEIVWSRWNNNSL